MKPTARITILVCLALGIVATLLTQNFFQDRDQVAPAVVSTPVSVQSRLSDEKRELWDKLAGEWASWDGQQVASFDGHTFRFQVTKGWPDLEGKNFSLTVDGQTFRSESGFYFVNVLIADTDAMRFIKTDLASKDISSFQLFRVGTPRARSRPPLPDTPPPAGIQATLDQMARMKSTADLYEPVEPASSARDLSAEVISYETSLSGNSLDSIVRLGDGEEWMIEISEYPRGKITKRRIVRGSAELIRKGEGGISEYPYPYYVDGKLITGVSANGLHQVKVLNSSPDDR